MKRIAAVFLILIILSATSVSAERARFIAGQLHGITILNRDAICMNEKNQPWACGQFAEKTLRSLILEHGIECTEVGGLRVANTFVCENDQFAVNSALVSLGLAITIDTNQNRYYENEQLARKNSRGVWRAGEDWVVKNKEMLFSTENVSKLLKSDNFVQQSDELQHV